MSGSDGNASRTAQDLPVCIGPFSTLWQSRLGTARVSPYNPWCKDLDVSERR